MIRKIIIFNFQSILFYGSDFRVDDLPTWKFNDIPWGLLHEESPRNNPVLVHQKTLNLFTYSSTFSRFSDVPLTLVDLPGRTELLSEYNQNICIFKLLSVYFMHSLIISKPKLIELGPFFQYQLLLV